MKKNAITKIDNNNESFQINQNINKLSDKEIEELKKDKEKREKLNRDLEIEEQRYRDLMRRRQSNNRDSLTGFGVFSAGALIIGCLSTGCNIF
jgi:hypothetical protein